MHSLFESAIMKTIALIISVVALVAMVAADDQDRKLGIIRPFHDECQAETNTKVDEDMITKFFNDELVDKTQFGKYALCMNVKSGLQKENGDIDKEALKKIIKARFEISDEIVAECGEKKGNTAEEAALVMAKCFRKHQPHQVKNSRMVA